MLVDIRLLAMFPPLPLTRAEAQGDDGRPPWAAQPREDIVAVELAVEVEATDRHAGLLGIVQDIAESLHQSPPVVEVADGDRDAEAVTNDVESDVAIGAMGAPLLPRLDELGVLRFDGRPVVGELGEVDRDVDGMRGDEGTHLLTKSEGERPLGLSSTEMLEDSLGTSLGRATLRASPGSSDRIVLGSGSREQVPDPTKNLPRELLLETDRQEGEEPGQGSGSHLPVGEQARSPSSPPQRRVFPFGLVSLPGRKPGPVAVGVHNLASRGLPLQTWIPVEEV